MEECGPSAVMTPLPSSRVRANRSSMGLVNLMGYDIKLKGTRTTEIDDLVIEPHGVKKGPWRLTDREPLHRPCTTWARRGYQCRETSVRRLRRLELPRLPRAT